MSPLCEDLLRRLLTPDPEQRLSLAAAMEHPWSRAGMPPPLATLNGRLLVGTLFDVSAPLLQDSAARSHLLLPCSCAVLLLQHDHMQLGVAMVSDYGLGVEVLAPTVFAGARVSEEAVDEDVQRARDPVSARAEGNCGGGSLQGLCPAPFPTGMFTGCCIVLGSGFS